MAVLFKVKSFDGVIAVVLLLLACLLLKSKIFPSEELQSIGSKDIDFGTILDGNLIEIKAEVINSTSKDIVITGLTANCTCVSSNADRLHLAPEETATITASESSHFKQEVNRSIGISWKSLNGTRHGCLVIGYHGDVVLPIQTEQLKYDLGNIPVDRSTPLTVCLDIKKKKSPLKWTDLKVIGTQKIVVVDSQKVSDGEFLFHIKVDSANQIIGSFVDGIKISFYDGDIDTKYSYTLPLSGRFTFNVTAIPNTLYFGVIPVNSAKEGEIRLSSEGKAIGVESIDLDQPGFVKIISQNIANNSLVLHYEVTPTQLGNHSGKILLNIVVGKHMRKMYVPYFACVMPTT